MIYKLADNLMQFNESKFERMSHGNAVKDLGVLTSRDITFSEHIDDLVLSSKIKAGLLLRTFKTKIPKLLFSYERRENNRINKIGPFKKDNQTVHTSEVISTC